MAFSIEMCTRKATMKRSRRWFSTAIVMLTSSLVDMGGSSAFSPASDILASQNAEKRRSVRSGDGRISEDNTNKWITVSATDINVAMAPGMIGIYEGPTIGGGKKPKSRENTHQLGKAPTDSQGLSPGSRSLSLGTAHRGSRLLRSKSHNTSSRVQSKDARLDHLGLLDNMQERKLTVSIRSLRRVVRIRDTLVDTIDTIPTEGEWAAACKLSVIGLRRVLYEGQQARTVLVSANAGLVTAIAKRQFSSLKYATEAGGGVGTILTIQDLIQEGNLGLMQAAERFEADRGHRFSTYATYWIKQRILRAISDTSRIIRLPAHVHSMLQKINKAKKEVTKEIGRTPSCQELAQYLEVSVEELEKYASRTRNVVSLESPLRTAGSLKEDRRTIGDLIVSDAPTPEEDVHRKSLKDDIRAVIDELAEREREVLILRFGLENGEPMTVTQTAKQLDISVDRVRLVETRALNKLRNPQTNYRLKEYMGEQTIEEEQLIEELESAPEKIWFF